MQTLDTFLPRILIWATDAPQPLVKQMLVDTAIQFCVDTDIVQVQLDPMDLVEDQQDYDLDLPRGTQLARVLSVVYGEGPLKPVGLGPAYYQWTAPATLTVFPKPTADATAWMHVKIATKPTRSATSLDDTLWNDYVEAIVGGTVARLCAMQGQQFTNATNATMGSGWYMQGVSKAKYELRKDRTAQDLRVQPRPFAPGRRQP